MSDRDSLVMKDAKLLSPNNNRALNPEAAEFVPSSCQFIPRSRSNLGSSTYPDVPGSSGKVMSKLSVANGSKKASDDEAHKYWLEQLPDDITPDFRNENLSGDISLTGLSIHDHSDSRNFQMPDEILAIPPQRNGAGGYSRYSGYHDLEYNSGDLSVDIGNHMHKLWDVPYSAESVSREGPQYNGVCKAAFGNELLDDDLGFDDNVSVDPVGFLSLNFPGFASECLSDVYYANGCDLNMTIEVLTQLELQVDGGCNQDHISTAPLLPNFSSIDFPSLPTSDAENTLTDCRKDDARKTSGRNQLVDNQIFSFQSYNSSHLKGDQDFASAVRKCVPLDDSHWKSKRNCSTEEVIGSSRGSVHQFGSYISSGKSIFGDKVQRNSREAPIWLETGDAVGNLYSESREEARDLARLRNACFEQARQAYLTGNKALAKELSLKGKIYGMRMAAAHEKARELIYKQRNPIAAAEMQSCYRGKELMIDLHGLHVSEALYVLKHELGVLRKTARSSGQRLQVLICVGTGHHTKGSKTPARLPLAVEKYLLEERLQFSEPQPGLFCTVVH